MHASANNSTTHIRTYSVARDRVRATVSKRWPGVRCRLETRRHQSRRLHSPLALAHLACLPSKGIWIRALFVKNNQHIHHHDWCWRSAGSQWRREHSVTTRRAHQAAAWVGADGRGLDFQAVIQVVGAKKQNLFFVCANRTVIPSRRICTVQIPRSFKFVSQSSYRGGFPSAFRVTESRVPEITHAFFRRSFPSDVPYQGRA